MSGTDRRSVAEQCEILQERFRLKANLLNCGRMKEDEFFYNVIINMVAAPEECWCGCLDVLEGRADALFSYAREFLERSDFMPCPRIFIAGTQSEERVAEKQRELRPKYKRLFETIERRAGSA